MKWEERFTHAMFCLLVLVAIGGMIVTIQQCYIAGGFAR